MPDMYFMNLHLAMPQKCCCPFLPLNTALHCHFPKKRALLNNQVQEGILKPHGWQRDIREQRQWGHSTKVTPGQCHMVRQVLHGCKDESLTKEKV